MGWEDRDYHKESSGGGMGGTLWSILSASVPLFRVFGIRVRLHASFIFFAAWALLFNPLSSPEGFLWGARTALTGMAVLFGIVLLHEFGHCFAARWMGGDARDILMTPIGGLAFAQPPQRPWPVFVTVACGPLVNVLICIVTGLALWLLNRHGVIFQASLVHPVLFWVKDLGPTFYLAWIYQVSYWLLLFNLLPIFPMDGGRMLQAILWPRIGYFRSMNVAYITGMIGGVIMGLYGLSSGQLILFFVALFGVQYCYLHWRMLKETGPGGMDGEYDYAQSDDPAPRKRHRVSERLREKLRQRAQREQQEQGKIDTILAKVSAQGMQSLTWWERRTLRQATERQRERDVEFTRTRD